MGVEETEAVIIGLRQKFDMTGLGQGVKGTHHFRAIFLKLLENDACDTVSDLKSPVESAYDIQKKTIGGKVTFIGYLAANGRVFIFIEIVLTSVKYSVMSQPHGLMDLKVETN
jgi:hypothetical protein